MIDTHVHLFDVKFEGEVSTIIHCAKEHHVEKMILVGFNPETNQKVQKLAKEYDCLYPTAGLHPSEVNDFNGTEIQKLEEWILENKVYAIGECGLDYYWHKDNKERQHQFLIQQIELALKYDLPVILHCRDAYEDLYHVLEPYDGKLRFVMHAYSGSAEMMRRFVALGGYISLAGPVTFPNASNLHRVAVEVPLERLMIETDCPYMSPVPNRGKRNEPQFVRFVLAKISDLRKVELSKLEDITTKNAEEFFRIGGLR